MPWEFKKASFCLVPRKEGSILESWRFSRCCFLGEDCGNHGENKRGRKNEKIKKMEARVLIVDNMNRKSSTVVGLSGRRAVRGS